MAASQHEIESWLWDAATILRGPVDPGNFRDFVFPLLFLKRLSDMWDEEQIQAQSSLGSHFSEEAAADFHTFQIPPGCHWSDLRRAAENQGITLQVIMQKIEQANPDRLAQIFGNASWADPEKMPPERLLRLIEHFSSKDLRPSNVSNDILGGGYEYLLKKFSDENATSAGQFFTPREVVHLLVRMLAPQPTESIYDPACGSGGMLIAAAEEVKQSGGSVARMRFYGQEVNQTSAAIGRMNLFIHEVEDGQIRRDDTLNNPKFVEPDGKLQQFDVVLANPPFILKDWGAERWAMDPHKRAFGGVPPAGNGDFAWIQHMLASMKSDSGRVGVVMPHGVLFRPDTEAQIRKAILLADKLEAIVSIGPNLFYGTQVPAVLLILRADKKTNKGKVFFVDASRRFVKGKAQNHLSQSDVKDIHDVFASGVDSKTDRIASRLVPLSEIEAQNFDLSVSRYIKADAIEYATVEDSFEYFQNSTIELRNSESRLSKTLKAVGYGS